MLKYERKGYILKPSRPRNKSHGKEWGPVYKTLFYSSVLLPKVVALYSVNTGKNEDIASESSKDRKKETQKAKILLSEFTHGPNSHDKTVLSNKWKYYLFQTPLKTNSPVFRMNDFDIYTYQKGPCFCKNGWICGRKLWTFFLQPEPENIHRRSSCFNQC